jgi:hypothetical protein
MLELGILRKVSNMPPSPPMADFSTTTGPGWVGQAAHSGAD